RARGCSTYTGGSRTPYPPAIFPFCPFFPGRPTGQEGQPLQGLQVSAWDMAEPPLPASRLPPPVQLHPDWQRGGVDGIPGYNQDAEVNQTTGFLCLISALRLTA